MTAAVACLPGSCRPQANVASGSTGSRRATPDGRCTGVYAPSGGPPALPDMVGALFVSEGRVWPEVG
jgi:hypothetical protein